MLMSNDKNGTVTEEKKK